ncbi:hypothetical protein LCGC14_0687540 [marine sediment metagenome]|uniref:Uncharacterized protein n=1 Tax=marine sediment metagenome TaxID=412755 RepID=A0A0F9TUE7_9ZZZZ
MPFKNFGRLGRIYVKPKMKNPLKNTEPLKKKKKKKYKIVGVFKFPNGKTKRRTAYVSSEAEEDLYAQSWSQDSKAMGGWLDDMLIYKK